jgi:hypothetical protein
VKTPNVWQTFGVFIYLRKAGRGDATAARDSRPTFLRVGRGDWRDSHNGRTARHPLSRRCGTLAVMTDQDGWGECTDVFRIAQRLTCVMIQCIMYMLVRRLAQWML